MLLYVWLGITVATAVLELITLGLTSIWFTVGGLAALLAYFLGAKLWLQILVFVLVSLLMFLLVRPIVTKLLKVGKEKTNVDAIPGKTGVVTEAINPIEGCGLIKVEGQVWSAKPADGESKIPVGTKVVIVEIQGVKALVKKSE